MMKGDFTRWTFDASKQYSSVRLQQGRVLLDADWNEQLDIMGYRETTANKEIIGLNGVPNLTSFAIEIDEEGVIQLGKGLCYVDGILCENDENQESSGEEEITGDYLAYLEVWQHHVTAIEAEELREKALGGPDTTTRTQTYWQVKLSRFITSESPEKWQVKWKNFLEEREQKGKLVVRATGTTILPNDLYRVEIHQGGKYEETTTFKWARNNGSMAARVESIDSNRVTIISNPQAQFQVEDWIEITDEEKVKGGEPGFFAKINNIQGNDLILDPEAGDEIIGLDPRNIITTVRIWGAEASTIVEENEDGGYKTLENGIEVKFEENGASKYRTGDYWLIPTRSQEEIVWPPGGEEPHGIDYHYCPLAIVKYTQETDTWEFVKDCRQVFPGMTEVARATAVTDDDGIIKGTELSIGVQSYNDSRRAYPDDEKDKYTEDNLDIQGGKHLKLNVGFWKDELDGVLWPADGDRVEGMSFCVSDRPRMELDKYGRLGIGPGDDGSGTKEPKAWLDLQPNWYTDDEPPANGNEEYVGLRINPTFPGDGKKEYGLKVENSDVEIGGNLTVEGKSHLKSIVGIGTAPEKTIGVNVGLSLSVPEGVIPGEVVGLKLQPTLNASNTGDQLTGLHINPVFQNDSQSGVKHYGLIVEKGKVGIGTIDPTAGLELTPTLDASNNDDHLTGLLINPDFQHHSQSGVKDYGLKVEKGKVGIGSALNDDRSLDIGVDVRSGVIASNNNDKLVGLYIEPEFEDSSKKNVEHYGLIVQEGKVAIGPPSENVYPVEIDGSESRVENLEVTGDLEVRGNVTYYGDVVAYAVEKAAGQILLGDDNSDRVVVHATMSSQHTSGKLKLTSPLEIELGASQQDFLSLFSTAAAAPKSQADGRIVWKKGVVTKEGSNSEDGVGEEYEEESKILAAIHSFLNGADGDLRFGTASSEDDEPQDRMVITAEGNVAIGSEDPGTNKLKVTGGTTSLGGALTVTSGGVTLTEGDVTLADGDVVLSDGSVNIVGTEPTASKLTVGGATNLTGKLTVAPELFGDSSSAAEINPMLAATTNDQVLCAVKINPTFTDNEYDETAKKLGLHVASGDVAIDQGSLAIDQGSLAIGAEAVPNSEKLYVNGKTILGGTLTANASDTYLAGAEITQTLTATAANQTLSALKIQPTFTENDHDETAKKLGLHVASGDVGISQGSLAIGVDFESDYKLIVAGNTKIKGKDLVLQVDDNGDKQGVLFQNSGGKYTWRIYRENADDSHAYLKISGGWEENSTDLSDRVTIDKDGAVGIGKDPGVIVAGDTVIGDGERPSDGTAVKLDVEGIVRGQTFVEASDAKQKENIQLLKDGLGKILGLRGVTYKWKDGKEAAQKTTEIGLVAQEVEAIFPELVITDSQGMKSLSYSKLIAPLIEAVKEQQAQIVGLVNQVQQQQTQIEQLQALNNG
ncbi:MAG: tail fiber domain-containing protein [Hormoscilla sp. SP12CHS1]|nr:tail fiber domain-containing protein [Hormoscilla sp. SP12CHS1]